MVRCGVVLFLAVPLAAQIASFPYLQDLETFGTGTPGTLQGGWAQGAGDDFDWSVHTGGTPSSSTGPAGDHTTGGGIYLYTEASSPRIAGDTADLWSPAFDLGALACPTVSFWYHMYGAGMGTLELAVDGGSGPVTVWSLDGPQQTSGADPYRWSGPISLQGHGPVVTLRLRGVRGSSYAGDIALDDIEVLDFTGLDVGVAGIDQPVAGCGLGGAEPITITITNNACTPVSGVQARFTVTGPAASTSPVEPVPGTIAPGSAVPFTFAATANFAPEGTYTIIATALLAGDAAPANDSAVAVLEHPPGVTSYPVLETCETFSTGTPGGLTGGWTQSSLDDFDWTVDRGGTSSDTGPAADHTLGTRSGTYLYAEASTPRVPGDEAHLISPCLDLAGLAAPALRFWYHMYGADMGTLHLDILGSAGWTLDVWSRSGPQHSTASDPWLCTDPIWLAPYGTGVQLRFRAERGINTKSDMAIDDIEVLDGGAPDLALTALRSPVSTCLGSTEAVEVRLYNRSLASPAAGAQLTCTVTGPVAAALPPETVTGPIPPLATWDHTFGLPVDLSVPGTYTIAVSVALPGDIDPTNDVLVTQLLVPATQLSLFPHVEDFEGCLPGTPGGLPPGWWQEPWGDDFDWTVHQGSTPSASGPDVDHTLATPAGIYLYTETSAPVGPLDEAHLLSPCLDTAGLPHPVLRFWYHMYGRDMGSLHLDVAGGGRWFEDLWVATGPLQTAPTDPWAWSGPVDLSLLPPPLRLRFRGENGGGVTGDLALDDVQILDGSSPDVGVVSVDAPDGGCGLGLETVTVTLANHSTATPATGVPVQLTVTGPIPWSPPAELLAITLPPLGVASHTFAAPVDLSLPGSYTLTVTTLQAGDVEPANDTRARTLEHWPRITSYPYEEDFETGPGGWVSGGAPSSWELGTPAATVIATPAPGGTASWVTNLTGNHPPDEQSFVLGPCFDLTGIGDPWIALEVWWNAEWSWDGAALQASTDGGATWLVVGHAGDPDHWYTDDTIEARPGGQREGWTGRDATGDGSGGWLRAQHALDGLGGYPDVRLRVVFASDGSVQDEGFAFDNVWIGNGQPGAGCPLTLCGDCNQDGSVTILDALHAAQADVGLVTLAPPAFSSCNVTGVLEPAPGAAVTVLDALAIASVVSGLPTLLVCC
jgi:hypothetical protein